MTDYLEDKYLKAIFEEIENHGDSRWNNCLMKNAVILKQFFIQLLQHGIFYAL